MTTPSLPGDPHPRTSLILSRPGITSPPLIDPFFALNNIFEDDSC